MLKHHHKIAHSTLQIDPDDLKRQESVSAATQEK